jgi:3-hydroxyacyl-CoA dehydrogenase
VILFDLPAGGRQERISAKAIEAEAARPSPLATRKVDWIRPANYDQHLEALGCDLVIEAIAERLDWKRDLYAKIAPHLGPTAILASNTSGLSLAALSDAVPAELRARFCGIHFFNRGRIWSEESAPHPTRRSSTSEHSHPPRRGA